MITENKIGVCRASHETDAKGANNGKSQSANTKTQPVNPLFTEEVIQILDVFKLIGDKHEVIDETFKDTASFKKTEEGEADE
ncbi:hypothetical protein [Treponema sp. R80B11-R83G3]